MNRRLDALVLGLVAHDREVAGVVAVGTSAYAKALREAGRPVPAGVGDLLDALSRVARSGQLAAAARAAGEGGGVHFDLPTASAFSGLSTRTLRRRVAEGALPVARVGRRVLVNPVDLLDLLEAS